MNPPRFSPAALVGLLCCVLASSALSQCTCSQDAHITRIGTSCGTPAVTLNATPPILGQVMTFFVTSPLPNAVLFMASSSPPASPFFTPGGCAIYLNPADLMVFGPFTTNANGAWTLDIFSPNDPSLCGLVCNVQVAIAGGGGPDPAFRITNAIQGTMGCNGGGAGNGFPPGAFCSYTQGGFHGTGTPGQIYDNNFLTTFPSGIEAGHYAPGNGNAAPNGLRWTGNAAGRAALKTFLPGGGPSGAVASDQLNPLTSFGGGALAYQTVTLGLNVGFNNAGVLGGQSPGFANLIYINPGDSLSGLSVTQILAVANDALAGLGLPAGYSFGSLVTPVDNLNESFDDCQMSLWASNHLFAP